MSEPRGGLLLICLESSRCIRRFAGGEASIRDGKKTGQIKGDKKYIYIYYYSLVRVVNPRLWQQHCINISVQTKWRTLTERLREIRETYMCARVCTCSRLAAQIAVDISGNDGESKIKCKMECRGEMEIMSLFAWENIGKIRCVSVCVCVLWRTRWWK